MLLFLLIEILYVKYKSEEICLFMQFYYLIKKFNFKMFKVLEMSFLWFVSNLFKKIIKNFVNILRLFEN